MGRSHGHRRAVELSVRAKSLHRPGSWQLLPRPAPRPPPATDAGPRFESKTRFVQDEVRRACAEIRQNAMTEPLRAASRFFPQKTHSRISPF
eukprot:3174570-Rhodomonas_salina.2